jgi:hypothetical protein
VTQIKRSSTPGQERTKLSKAIVVTIREFMRQNKPDGNTQDMVAFIISALKHIAKGIDQSVTAWEKRGYWVKADKYRLEWQWTGFLAEKIEASFKTRDWGNIAQLLVEVMGHFNSIKISDQHRMGQPWKNAYKEYQKLG